MKKDIRNVLQTTIHHGVSLGMMDAHYREFDGLNPSSIVGGIKGRSMNPDELTYSARYVRHAYETRTEPTKNLIVGQYGHALLLEPHTLEDRFVVWDGGDKRTKEWKLFKADHEGETIVDADDVDGIATAVTKALERPEVRRLCASGEREVSVFSAEYGLQTKGRLDWINNHVGMICDVKFTSDLESRAFWSSVKRFRYLEKMACYQQWHKREAGLPKVLPCCFIGIQYDFQKPDRKPHDAAVIPIPQELLDWGWKVASRMIGVVREAIDADSWPGVDGGADTYPLDIPLWDIPDLDSTEVQFSE